MTIYTTTKAQLAAIAVSRAYRRLTRNDVELPALEWAKLNASPETCNAASTTRVESGDVILWKDYSSPDIRHMKTTLE